MSKSIFSIAFSLVVAAGASNASAQLTTLVSFTNTNGANPYGALTLSGNTLYGTTRFGGANGFGTVFALVLPCIADFNHDSTVDFFDYLDFVAAFANQNPADDFNSDEVIVFFDYLDFVSAFASNCR